MKYPTIGNPSRAQDGTYRVTVHRGKEDREDLTYPDKASAEAGAEALRVAKRLLMPRGVAPKVTHVKGPHWDKTMGRWVVRWTEDGERRAFTHESKAVAAAKKLEIQPTTARMKLKALPARFDGSAQHFKDALASATKAANQAARDCDAEGLSILKAYIPLLRDMAAAIVPHAGYLELEQQHARLVQFVEDLFAGRATLDAAEQTALGSLAATLPGRTRPN